MFYEILYAFCAQKGIKPNTVAKALGLSTATATKWKNGSVPNGEVLIKLADYLDCSIDYLLGRTDIPEINRSSAYKLTDNHILSVTKSADEAPTLVQEAPVYDIQRKIAVLGKVAAGIPILSYENNYGTITPESRISSYALLVQGDSMSPVILDKEYIEVIIQPALEQGEIGIIRVNDTTTCKKFYDFPDHYELRSINPEYDTMHIKKTPSTTLHIMGKVSLSEVQKKRFESYFL